MQTGKRCISLNEKHNSPWFNGTDEYLQYQLESRGLLPAQLSFFKCLSDSHDMQKNDDKMYEVEQKAKNMHLSDNVLELDSNKAFWLGIIFQRLTIEREI